MNNYLRATTIIDWKTPIVLECAQHISEGYILPTEVIRECFIYVRDQILHSGDHKSTVTTCIASEVLQQGTGWCFAKSHLLAALLRANGIPTGLCYQRLARDDGNGFTLHGLNAVYLQDIGWYRIDARGNKPGVDAQFCPPREQLAWPVVQDGECDFPEIWPDPAPIVIECLSKHVGWQAVKANLPDIQLIGGIY